MADSLNSVVHKIVSQVWIVKVQVVFFNHRTILSLADSQICCSYFEQIFSKKAL